jgi:hypothetical protein
MYGALCIVSLPIRCFQNSESCTLYMLYWRDIVPWSLQQRPAQRLEELGHTLSQTLLRTSAVQHNAKNLHTRCGLSQSCSLRVCGNSLHNVPHSEMKNMLVVGALFATTVAALQWPAPQISRRAVACGAVAAVLQPSGAWRLRL